MNLLILLVWLSIGAPSPLLAATTEEIDVPYTTANAELFIRAAARHYGANEQELLNTLWCESHFDATTVGDHGTSYGVAQIHLPAHRDITKAQALDPVFAIQWAAKQFAKGNQKIWTCFGNTSYERLNSP